MVFAVAAAIVLLGILAYFYVQSHAFNSMIWKEVGDMAEGSAVQPETVADIGALPGPLRRYLAYAIDEGRENAGLMRMRHGGSFRMKEGADWLNIRGEEYFHCSQPGFIWTGRVSLNPLLWVRARDIYWRGSGNMLVKMRGALTLADVRGKEMDAASLLRYLAELPWIPTAMRTLPGLTWEAIDDNTVKATLRDGDLAVSGAFTIDDAGRITAFYSEERYREVDGRQERCPWRGEFREYFEQDGLRIPREGEVKWLLDGGEHSYARFRLEKVEFDVPAAF